MAPIRIFVSYAREECRFLGYKEEEGGRWVTEDDSPLALIPWLAKSTRKYDTVFWYDKKDIGASDGFRARIESEIDEAQIAILMVSSAFLESAFIRNVELPRIRSRVIERGLRVVPILVEPCGWKDIDFVGPRVAPPEEFRPLVDLIGNKNDWPRVRDGILQGLVRVIEQVRGRVAAGGPLVFISACSADTPQALQVHKFLEARGVRTFFSQKMLPLLGSGEYFGEINEQLDQAQHLVLVTSRFENAMSGWVKYEWSTFANEKNSGRKTGNLVTMLVGSLKPGDLPIALRQYEALHYDDQAMERLLRYVGLSQQASQRTIEEAGQGMTPCQAPILTPPPSPVTNGRVVAGQPDRIQAIGTEGRPYCFFIMRYGQRQGLFERIRDIVTGETSLACIRADDLRSSGAALLALIRARIDRASLVLADISVDSPNIHHEVGYAVARKKPILLIAREDVHIPTDLMGMAVVRYAPKEGDLARFDGALREQLKAVRISLDPPVFISAKSSDYQYAAQVNDFLRSSGIPTFFSQETLPRLGNSDYRKEIDRALDRAEHMIVVGSSSENVLSDWVEYEWGFFVSEKLSRRKAGNIITVTVGSLKLDDLPPALRRYEVVPFDPKNLHMLLGYVVRQ